MLKSPHQKKPPTEKLQIKLVCPLSNIQIITSSLQYLTKWHTLGLHTFDSIELGAVGQICLVCHNEGQGQKWYQSPRLAGSSKTVINQNFPDYVVKKKWQNISQHQITHQIYVKYYSRVLFGG